MIICLCRGLPESAIRATIAQGASTVAEIRRACGAGGDCGACCSKLADLVGQARRPAWNATTASNWSGT